MGILALVVLSQGVYSSNLSGSFLYTVRLGDFALLGELSLNGSVHPVHGMLSMAASLHQHGLYGMIVPTQNAREAATADGPLVYGVSTLQEAAEILEGDVRQQPYELNIDDVFKEHDAYSVDFSEVRGQDHAKRALEVAAAGRHNLLTLGTIDQFDHP